VNTSVNTIEQRFSELNREIQFRDAPYAIRFGAISSARTAHERGRSLQFATHPVYNPTMRLWRRFAVRESGQDLVEYTLLLAFVTLGVAAILLGSGQSVNSIWTTTSTQLKKGHAYAKGQDK